MCVNYNIKYQNVEKKKKKIIIQTCFYKSEDSKKNLNICNYEIE